MHDPPTVPHRPITAVVCCSCSGGGLLSAFLAGSRVSTWGAGNKNKINLHLLCNACSSPLYFPLPPGRFCDGGSPGASGGTLRKASINRLVRDPYHAGGMRVQSHESAHFAASVSRRKRPQERPTSPSSVDVTQLFESGTEHAVSAAPPRAAPPAAEAAQSPSSPAFVTEPTAAEPSTTEPAALPT